MQLGINGVFLHLTCPGVKSDPQVDRLSGVPRPWRNVLVALSGISKTPLLESGVLNPRGVPCLVGVLVKELPGPLWYIVG